MRALLLQPEPDGAVVLAEDDAGGVLGEVLLAHVRVDGDVEAAGVEVGVFVVAHCARGPAGGLWGIVEVVDWGWRAVVGLGDEWQSWPISSDAVDVMSRLLCSLESGKEREVAKAGDIGPKVRPDYCLCQ